MIPEKEYSGQYFRTVVENLAGGVVVIHCGKDGELIPEFMSRGFAEMTGMTLEEAWQLYGKDGMAGVHPDDYAKVSAQIQNCLSGRENHAEIIYRLKKGMDSYVWVKNTLSLVWNEDGEGKLYAAYHDMTGEREEQEQIRRQYKELVLQHYRALDSDVLIVSHCNISQNRILEVIDRTPAQIMQDAGTERRRFFGYLSSYITDEEERRGFLEAFANETMTAAFEKKEIERVYRCFMQFPEEPCGRYVQMKVDLLEEPDTGSLTGILTMTDITDQEIADRTLHQLLVTGCDFVVDLNLMDGNYRLLTAREGASSIPAPSGNHLERLSEMTHSKILPKYRDYYVECLMPEEIRRRLKDKDSYAFTFSIMDDGGEIRTKRMTVSAIDLRLGRVCLARTDITDSIREQQGLLRMIAYTFELAGFINLADGSFTLYTRETVLENLAPHYVENYSSAVERFVSQYTVEDEYKTGLSRLKIESMLENLEKRPNGYDFLFSYQSEGKQRFKQYNVLWGDGDHSTVCLVRADVTEVLAAERAAKKELEDALALAKEASRAKSDFLSSMSHDIRTPMNAIMGMAVLAEAHIDDKGQVENSIRKILVSSKHLLSLINDILDMSKIERSVITLGRMPVCLPELVKGLTEIIEPQAEQAGITLEVKTSVLSYPYILGDMLRLNQILINILGNALKFTPAGGRISLAAEEFPSSKGDHWVRCRFEVRDTGVGMTKEFQQHVFEPFTRSETAADVEGTGLGMSITKGLVDLMGGKITVESEPGAGTMFCVELDCEISGQEDAGTPGTENPGDSVKRQERAFENRRFLIAEDNEINAEILCGLLELYGAQSVVKADGALAVEELKNTKPGTYDAIFMDVRMPNMNGYQATRAIRKLDRPDAKTIPIVAMTANAFAEDVKEALEAGMNAHLSKPVDLKALNLTLGKLLEKK